jgi:hypothetical protein
LAPRAKALSRDDFVRSFHGAKLLVVLLEGRSDRLRHGLIEHPTDEGSSWNVRSDSTLGKTQMVDIFEGPHSSLPPLDATPDLDGESLLALLERGAHYFTPLRKRPGAVNRDSECITVGRSRSNDIVLIDQSVSKLHAFLEYDELEHLYVSDAGSTNLTRVGERIVSEGDLVHFQLGEELRFGDVAVRVCLPGVLWDAMSVLP